MPSLTLLKTKRNSQHQKRDCSNNSSRQQLDLFSKEPSAHKQSVKPVRATAPPAQAITEKLAPASHYHSAVDRYWGICLPGKEQYGGLFYRAEIDCILAHFSKQTRPIELDKLGQVAARAVAIFTGQMRVAT